jgi:hypothetical protein
MMEEGAVGEPAGVAGLAYGEHLLVWTLRKIVARRDVVCPVIAREFAEVCGADADRVLATFRAFLDSLGLTARRRISIGHPGWFGLTGDERQILGMIRAAQDDDQGRLAAQVCWFAQIERQSELADAARALAAAFAAHELLVFSAPPPNSAVPIGGPPLGLVS